MYYFIRNRFLEFLIHLLSTRPNVFSPISKTESTRHPPISFQYLRCLRHIVDRLFQAVQVIYILPAYVLKKISNLQRFPSCLHPSHKRADALMQPTFQQFKYLQSKQHNRNYWLSSLQFWLVSNKTSQVTVESCKECRELCRACVCEREREREGAIPNLSPSIAQRES